ncbi:MAG: hypothetical protein KAS49_02230 [Candidatus Cloacimonetes bacterium]|nr:hypothetical protein [Candidatus Cloacimonadota bacterium]
MLKIILIAIMSMCFGFFISYLINKHYRRNLLKEKNGWIKSFLNLQMLIRCLLFFIAVILIYSNEMLPDIAQIAIVATIFLLLFSTGYDLGRYCTKNCQNINEMMLPIFSSLTFLTAIVVLVKFVLGIDLIGFIAETKFC